MFDVDGTLVDSLPAIILGLGDAYEHFNGARPDDETLRSLVGMPLRQQMRLYSRIPADDERVSKMCMYTIDRFEARSHMETEFVPAVEALRELHERGCPTAIVTSKSKRELDFFLERFRGSRWLSATVCSSDVSHPKPHGESALLACNRLQVQPESACFIGDSLYDMECARHAGVRAIGVSYGGASPNDLRAAGAELVLDSPEQLLAWAQKTVLTSPCLERK